MQARAIYEAALAATRASWMPAIDDVHAEPAAALRGIVRPVTSGHVASVNLGVATADASAGVADDRPVTDRQKAGQRWTGGPPPQ